MKKPLRARPDDDKPYNWKIIIILWIVGVISVGTSDDTSYQPTGIWYIWGNFGAPFLIAVVLYRIGRIIGDYFSQKRSSTKRKT